MNSHVYRVCSDGPKPIGRFLSGFCFSAPLPLHRGVIFQRDFDRNANIPAKFDFLLQPTAAHRVMDKFASTHRGSPSYRQKLIFCLNPPRPPPSYRLKFIFCLNPPRPLASYGQDGFYKVEFAEQASGQAIEQT